MPEINPLPVSAATRERLQEVKGEQESYDDLLQRLVTTQHRSDLAADYHEVAAASADELVTLAELQQPEQLTDDADRDSPDEDAAEAAEGDDRAAEEDRDEDDRDARDDSDAGDDEDPGETEAAGEDGAASDDADPDPIVAESSDDASEPDPVVAEGGSDGEPDEQPDERPDAEVESDDE